MDIRLAILDLGRVVFDFDWDRAFAVWRRFTALPDGIAEADLDDRVHFAFERGEITPEAFHAHVVRQFDLTLSFEQFEEGWNAIYGPAYPAVVSVLEPLSGRVPVVAFTNTNELHRPAWEARFADVLAHFDRVFVSSLIGLRKPEGRGFEHILGCYGVSPDRALFFDDVEENVQAARELGIHGVRVGEPGDVVRGLERFGLLAT